MTAPAQPVERAPGPVGVLLGVAVAILVLLVGPLLLFNPLLTSTLQQRHAVAEAFGTTQAEVDRVTSSFLVDIALDGPFDASLDEAGGEPLLDAEERSHMTDVSRLVRLLAAVVLAAGLVAVASGIALRREPGRRGRIILLAAGAIGTAALVLGVVFAVAFEPMFLLFHELFFPPGTYLFPEGSDLITLFPEGFWFDAALLAGAAIVVTAAAVGLLGVRAWRRGAKAWPGGPSDDRSGTP
jgi:integral membrane protein (TIGR01906 family)